MDISQFLFTNFSSSGILIRLIRTSKMLLDLLSNYTYYVHLGLFVKSSQKLPQIESVDVLVNKPLCFLLEYIQYHLEPFACH